MQHDPPHLFLFWFLELADIHNIRADAFRQMWAL